MSAPPHSSGRAAVVRMLCAKPAAPPLPPPTPTGLPPAFVPDDQLSSLQRTWGFLWDPAEPTVRARLAAALMLMVGAKLLTIQVPFLFKEAIDGLATTAAAAHYGPIALTPAALMLAYGAARSSAEGMTQLRNALFALLSEPARATLGSRHFGGAQHRENAPLELAKRMDERTLWMGALEVPHAAVDVGIPGRRLGGHP